MKFTPTHRIHLDSGETIHVMECDGAAYTEAEFEASDLADYEVDADGAWTFLGAPFAGTVERLPPFTPNDSDRNPCDPFAPVRCVSDR